MARKETKSYFVLGQNGSLGEVIRCTDTSAAEFELGQMRGSNCQRIARTTRQCTETEAMVFFQGAMAAVCHRDSRFNIAVEPNTFEEIARKTRRRRDTLNAY